MRSAKSWHSAWLKLYTSVKPVFIILSAGLGKLWRRLLSHCLGPCRCESSPGGLYILQEGYTSLGRLYIPRGVIHQVSGLLPGCASALSYLPAFAQDGRGAEPLSIPCQAPRLTASTAHAPSCPPTHCAPLLGSSRVCTSILHFFHLVLVVITHVMCFVRSPQPRRSCST